MKHCVFDVSTFERGQTSHRTELSFSLQSGKTRTGHGTPISADGDEGLGEASK